MINAFILLRVSSKEQFEGGYSIAAQRGKCAERCAQEGWGVAGEVEFPLSGRTIAHTREFKEMVQTIKDDPTIKRLVMVELDRLMRNSEDFTDLRRTMRELGVQLVSVNERFDESPSGRFMQTVQAARAEYESDLISERIRRGQMQKLKEGGWPGKAFVGYRMVRRDGERRNEALLEVDPDQADLVRRAFQLYATGDWPVRALHAEMTRQGLRTSRGTPLVISKFMEMLHDKRYVGILKWKGIEVPGKHPPLIERELYDRVQDVFRQHDLAGDRVRTHPNYLRGTLFCGECGSRLSSMLAKGRFPYFYCLGMHSRRQDCHQPYARLKEIESTIEDVYGVVPELVLQRFHNEIKTTLEVEIAAQQRQRTETERVLERQLKKLTTEKERLLAAYLKKVIDVETFGRHQERITTERSAVEQQLAKIRQAPEVSKQRLEALMGRLDEFRREYRTASERSRRAYNQALFEAVFVKDRRIVGVRLKEPYRTALTKGGSDKNPTVELRGLEPLTPWLPAKCSTN
jgi:site-specific DNA recombinase